MGGRDGYETLSITDLSRELNNLAKFYEVITDYKKIGFEGQLLIEPKLKEQEPSKHKYDYDVAKVIAFLLNYGIEDYFKVNIECNHSTLEGHTFQHELRLAWINNLLGSIDANEKDLLLGWDTDHFSSDIYLSTMAMYEVLKN